MDYPSRQADQFVIRFPDGWRDAIKAEAAKSRRSMNAEILSAIEFAMKERGVQLDAPAQK
ncbi:Arc family DNA-binding protein [Salipiger marinus]|uniref:Arc family DNA-binding protein n=1 Tax=Salipiger marinus TaxID=555512 RepID=UPI002C08AA2B|nr:Arc family DNA-binding protein [Salipiger manganoxidans]MEB3419894.1 Arc family DNA-binding protein [Salipiger manganoxidans]